MTNTDTRPGEDQRVALLPCPFCGSEVEQEAFGYYHLGTESREIRCVNPKCPVKPYISLDQDEDQFDMVEAWNTRALRRSVAPDVREGESKGKSNDFANSNSAVPDNLRNSSLEVSSVEVGRIRNERLASENAPRREVEVEKVARFETTSFDEVDCKHTDCRWPECECPKKPSGGFACPICGKDTPHHHADAEVALRKEALRKYYAGTDHHPIYRRVFIDGGLFALAHPAPQGGDARELEKLVQRHASAYVAPDVREALEKIVNEPIGYHAASRMHGIAKRALASLPASGTDGEKAELCTCTPRNRPDCAYQKGGYCPSEAIPASENAPRREVEGKPVAWRWKYKGEDSWQHCSVKYTPPPGVIVEALVSAHPAPQGGDAREMIADRETAQTLLDLLNPLHSDVDRQLTDEREWGAPDDREYNINITARMERDLTQAVLILENRLRATPPALYGARNAANYRKRKGAAK
jgi:hypothetical protein